MGGGCLNIGLPCLADFVLTASGQRKYLGLEKQYGTQRWRRRNVSEAFALEQQVPKFMDEDKRKDFVAQAEA